MEEQHIIDYILELTGQYRLSNRNASHNWKNGDGIEVFNCPECNYAYEMVKTYSTAKTKAVQKYKDFPKYKLPLKTCEHCDETN